MNRRWVAYGAVGVGLVVAAIVAVIAFQSLEVPFNNTTDTNAPPRASGCSPTPCADVKGYSLHVSNVQISGSLVSMQVTFRNSSASTHASPEDLTLVDANHHASGLITGPPGCSTWARHEFNDGEVFGPIFICFQVSTSRSPLTLQWSPDFGFFCCQTEIVIA